MITKSNSYLRWTLLVLALGAAPLAQAGLVYTADSRNLTTSAALDGGSDTDSQSAIAAVFDAQLVSQFALGLSSALGSAQQTSALTEMGVVADGLALASVTNVGNFVSLAGGEASLFVSFESASAFDFSLVGSVTGAAAGFGSAQALVSLLDNGAPVAPLLVADSATGGGVFSFSGRLSSGSYSLVAFALADAFDTTSETARFDFVFATTPVPLPAGVWLLLSALVGIGAAPRRAA